MKTVITTFLIFIVALSVNAQVCIDKINAPENPAGPYWAELKNREAKGDVYSIDFAVFPREGKLVYLPSIITLEQAIKEKKPFIEVKNGLIVKEKAGYSDQVTMYAYDANKNIIREENSHWIFNYKYDTKNRLIEKIATSKKETNIDNKTKKTIYIYEQINEELVVTKTWYTENTKTFSKTHYKNGLELLNTYENDVRKKAYVFDEKGNWIVEKTTSNNSWQNNTLERTIIYYSDLDFGIKNKQFNWELIPFAPGSDIGFPVIIYNNGRKPSSVLSIKKFTAARTIDDSALFYLELGNHYYFGKDAFKSREAIGLKGFAKEVSTGSEALFESKGGYVRLYDQGKNLKNFAQYYTEKCYYVADSLGTNHYIIGNFDPNADKQFYPATKYTNTKMFYTIEAKKNTYQLFENGKPLDYTGITKWQYTEAGDRVVQYKGNPYMILVDSGKNKTLGFYPAKAYNNEKIFDNDPTNPNDKGDTILATFNPVMPLKAIKIGEFTYRFFQNDVHIENPKCMVRMMEDKEVMFSYGYEDFIIANNPSSVIGNEVDVQKVARENEVIVMYINGKVGYFYNGCDVVTKENYKIAAIDNTKWLVYFSAFRKSIIVDITKPSTTRFVPYYTYLANDYLYKTTNGGTKLFSQGQGYAPNNYTVKTQGADAFIYVNGKLSFYLKNFSTANTNQMLALTPYK